MTQLQENILSLTGEQLLKIHPQGTSMCPFLLEGRDFVYVKAPTFPLKRGQIPVFQRKDGSYIIHRICRIQKTDKGTAYYMLGDNQTWIEGPIYEDQIHAITVHLFRKGRLIDCEKNLLYRMAASLWLALRPVRPIILGLQQKIKNRK